MRNDYLTRLTLAGMFAAMALICFSYLRIEIPMFGGMTGKIYIGHTFIILAGLIVGGRLGGLSGAVGLTLADLLAGYTTSAPPTFFAKFIFGYSVYIIAYKICRGSGQLSAKTLAAAAGGGEVVNIITEPFIRFTFKIFILGMPRELAYLSAVNCAIAEIFSAAPVIILSVLLYKALMRSVFKDYHFAG